MKRFSKPNLNLIDWDKRSQGIRLRERAYECIWDYNRIDDALGLLQEALESDPNDYLVHFLLGLTSIKNANHLKTIEKFQQVISLLENPRYKDSLPKDYRKEVQVYCYYYCGDAFSYQGEDFYNHIKYEDAADRYEKAIISYKNLLDLEPSNGFAFTNIGYALLQQQEIQKKKQNLEEASDLQEKARKYFERGTRISPEDYYCFEGIGYFYYQSYLKKEANKELSREDYERSEKNYVKALHRLSKIREAQSEIREAQSETPEAQLKIPEAQLKISEAQLKIREAQIHNSLGILYYSKGGRTTDPSEAKKFYCKAMEAFQAAIDKDDSQATYHSNLGDAYRASEDLDNAKKAYEEAIKQDVNNPDYLNTLGNIYFEMKAYRKAALQYIKALRKNPSEAVYHANLGDACKKLKKLKFAAKAYQNAIKQNPENAGYLNTLGNIYFEIKDYRQAALHYIEARRKNPSEAVYLANFGDACKKLKKLKFAAKAYQNAIKQNPENASYPNKLGNIYFEMKDYQQAAYYYIDALKNNPHEKVYESNLVLACEKLRDFSEVISSLESELQIKPECSQLRVVLKQLKSKQKYRQKYGAIHLDPLVTPIAVEAGRDLVPLVDDSNEEGRKFYKEKIVVFRDNLYQQLGIKFPGILFRENQDMIAQSFTIILHEVPIIMYQTKGMYLIDADKNQDSEKLKKFELNVEEETVSLIPNTSLAWISSNQLERAEQAGYKIWDRQAYILFALARTLKLYAANFIGIQETQNGIEEWKKKSNTNQTLVENTIPDVIDFSRLTLIFKRLVDEAIPILDFSTIFQVIHENRTDVKDIILLTEKVRYGLRGILQQKYCDGQSCIKAYTLSEEIEQTFAEGIKQEAGKGYLELDVETTQDLLAAFRAKLSTNNENIIVTRSPYIRPYVRELLRLEFSGIVVLCQAELEPEIAIESIAQIIV